MLLPIFIGIKEVVESSIIEYIIRYNNSDLKEIDSDISEYPYLSICGTIQGVTTEKQYPDTLNSTYKNGDIKLKEIIDLFILEMRSIATNGSFKDLSRQLSINDWFLLSIELKKFRDRLDKNLIFYDVFIKNIQLFEELIGKNIATILLKELSWKWFYILKFQPKYFWCHIRSKTLTFFIFINTILGIINYFK